jgi:FSR family fosmidomycin resistance protein-like MFS transporter
VSASTSSPQPSPSLTRRRTPAAIVFALLAVELLDELVFGARNAAWPLIRSDLRLSYEQIGILLAAPTIFAILVEPIVGILGDTTRRRALTIAGGVIFAATLVLTAVAHHWIALLVAFTVFSPASGTFVGLSQATLMDLEPERHEQLMARWVVAGSLGVVGGSALVGIAVKAGGSWRTAFWALTVTALLSLIGVARAAFSPSDTPVRSSGELLTDLRTGARDALRALRRGEVRRWLILLECSDMMTDVLGSLLALYLVDVAHASTMQAVVGVALFTGVGLGGDALLVPLLERVDGLRYLRVSVLLTMVAFPALLLAPTINSKLVFVAAIGLLNSGWYSIPKARLYTAMPDQSAGVLAITNAFGAINAGVPFVIGFVAQRVGLAPTMWILLVGPVALRRTSARRAPRTKFIVDEARPSRCDARAVSGTARAHYRPSSARDIRRSNQPLSSRAARGISGGRLRLSPRRTDLSIFLAALGTTLSAYHRYILDIPRCARNDTRCVPPPHSRYSSLRSERLGVSRRYILDIPRHTRNDITASTSTALSVSSQ